MRNKEGNNISVLVAKNIVYLGSKVEDRNIGDTEKALKLSPGYLSRCIGGGHRISVDVLMKASDYFGIDIESLITRDLESTGYFH